jgi:hypothetical protein
VLGRWFTWSKSHTFVAESMVTPGRFELPTNGLGNRCSIHLSYGATIRRDFQFITAAQGSWE